MTGPGIADPSAGKRYTDRKMTAHEHAWEIRRMHGYRDFADAEASVQLRGFLAGGAWTHAEDPVALSRGLRHCLAGCGSARQCRSWRA